MSRERNCQLANSSKIYKNPLDLVIEREKMKFAQAKVNRPEGRSNRRISCCWRVSFPRDHFPTFRATIAVDHSKTVTAFGALRLSGGDREVGAATAATRLAQAYGLRHAALRASDPDIRGLDERIDFKWPHVRTG